MRLLFRKNLGRLEPVDDAGEEAMRGIKHGSEVWVEVVRARNTQHHKLYWALVSMVFENQERYKTRDQLHDALKLAAGIYTQLVMPSGAVHKIPGSIAFDKMDQAEFSAFYNRVCDLIAEHFLPGVSSDDLKREVSSMIGIAA